MKKLEIVSYYVEQLNPHYDPSRSHNGGGYDQPHWTFNMSNGWCLDIHDTSCGEFGTRYTAELVGRSGTSLRYAEWGSMDEEEEWYSEFSLEDCKILEQCWITSGISWVPTK